MRRYGVLAVGIVLLLVYIRASWTAEPPKLEDVARKMLPEGEYGATYGWISNHEVVLHYGTSGMYVLDIMSGKRRSASDREYAGLPRRILHGAVDGEGDVEFQRVKQRVGENSTLLDRLYEPAGVRNVWLFSVDQLPPLQRILSHVFPTPGRNVKHRYEIWVSDPDGSNAVCVGVSNGSSRADGLVSELSRSPDGRTVGFSYRGCWWNLTVR